MTGPVSDWDLDRPAGQASRQDTQQAGHSAVRTLSRQGTQQAGHSGGRALITRHSTGRALSTQQVGHSAGKTPGRQGTQQAGHSALSR